MSSSLKHDAQSGFNDIKPLPQFQGDLSWLLIVLAIALVTLAAYFVRRRTRSESTECAPSSKEVALQQIRELSGAPRDHALRISAALRAYLETEFSFNALESTIKEIQGALPRALTSSCHLLTSARREQLEKEVLEVLSLCDRAIYQKSNSEITNALESVRDRACTLVSSLHRAKEDEKSHSVIAQSHEI